MPQSIFQKIKYPEVFVGFLEFDHETNQIYISIAVQKLNNIATFLIEIYLDLIQEFQDFWYGFPYSAVLVT